MRTSIAVAIILVMALGSAVAKQKHRRPAAPPQQQQQQQQIACTVIGCVPVPRGCWQTPGRTWQGDPTGGDVIVCPPGVAPFR